MHYEWLVKRKLTFPDLIKRIVAIIITIAIPFYILMAFKFNPKLFIIPVIILAALIYVTVIVFRRTNIEFEYIFAQDELRIDKIMNMTSRKNLENIEISKVELVTYEGTDAYNEYENKDYEYDDYSSGLESENKYYMYYRDDNGLTKIIFEPNEAILDQIIKLAPRKVIKK
ncbi:hypothetical protein SAMN02910289_00465 [Lachnospiraceae bacterium RM5]|nr:hypothetical protein SAMN02910289_00465 [Lachnospiraceae bacterium RM5]